MTQEVGQYFTLDYYPGLGHIRHGYVLPSGGSYQDPVVTKSTYVVIKFKNKDIITTTTTTTTAKTTTTSSSSPPPPPSKTTTLYYNYYYYYYY